MPSHRDFFGRGFVAGLFCGEQILYEKFSVAFDGRQLTLRCVNFIYLKWLAQTKKVFNDWYDQRGNVLPKLYEKNYSLLLSYVIPNKLAQQHFTGVGRLAINQVFVNYYPFIRVFM